MNKEVMRQLRWAVEKEHGSKAVAVKDVTVHLKQGAQTLWYGTVTVFELDDHPAAKTAYGWYYEIPTSGEQRYLSVLHAGSIGSPQDAVRAKIDVMRN